MSLDSEQIIIAYISLTITGNRNLQPSNLGVCLSSITTTAPLLVV